MLLFSTPMRRSGPGKFVFLLLALGLSITGVSGYAQSTGKETQGELHFDRENGGGFRGQEVRSEAVRCDNRKPANFQYQPIPVVDLPNSFRKSGWESISLGDCALRVDSEGAGAGGDGFITHGGPGQKGDAAFRIVFANEREFFVEIRDDEFVLGAGKWLHQDHIEIWTAAARSRVKADDKHGECVKQDGSSNHWAVLLDDGKAVKGQGSLDGRVSAKVHHVRNEGKINRIRLKVRLPEGVGPLRTIVYSDSDDGTGQERLIATSDVEYGEGMTIGEVKEYPDMRCDVSDSGREAGPAGEPLGRGGGNHNRSGAHEVPAEALPAVCGGPEHVVGKKCSSVCPPYTTVGDDTPDGTPYVPSFDERVSIDGHPALLVSTLCEPHAGLDRGLALIVRKSEGWKRVEYTQGVHAKDCERIEVPGTNPTFLCQVQSVTQGTLRTKVSVMRLELEGLEFHQLVQTVNESGGFCIDKIELEELSTVSYDENEKSVEVRASGLHVQLPDGKKDPMCSKFREWYDLPAPRKYEFNFSYNGGGFTMPDAYVDPESHRLRGVPVFDPSAD